ncbi:MAG TPA: ATP-binding protein [Actinomycetota bacterium]
MALSRETTDRSSPRMPATKRSFAAEPISLGDVRSFIRERAEGAALYGRDTDDLVQAVSEVCANAIQHADGDSFIVSWSGGPQRPTEVKIRDQGVFAAQGLVFSGRSRGLGLPLVAALVDELSIVRGTPTRPGTTVRLVKYRDT